MHYYDCDRFILASQEESGDLPIMPYLRVYVASHCPLSAYSIELAREVRVAFPQLHVQVIDVEQTGREKPALPDEVLFTPGYFLDGRPLCWGNPTREELFRLVSAALT